MRPNRTSDAFYRWIYLVAMYSGIRAVFNCIRSKMCAGACELVGLHKTRLCSQKIGDVMLFVHQRPSPRTFAKETAFGMISVRHRYPRVGFLLYRYFCLTSHFGCGHMEIAFYEKQGKVTLYAVRNTAASNAFRLKWFGISAKLTLAQWDERLLKAMVRHLENAGFVTDLADVSECIDLSVNR